MISKPFARAKPTSPLSIAAFLACCSLVLTAQSPPLADARQSQIAQAYPELQDITHADFDRLMPQLDQNPTLQPTAFSTTTKSALAARSRELQPLQIDVTTLTVDYYLGSGPYSVPLPTTTNDGATITSWSVSDQQWCGSLLTCTSTSLTIDYSGLDLYPLFEIGITAATSDVITFAYNLHIDFYAVKSIDCQKSFADPQAIKYTLDTDLQVGCEVVSDITLTSQVLLTPYFTCTDDAQQNVNVSVFDFESTDPWFTFNVPADIFTQSQSYLFCNLEVQEQQKAVPVTNTSDTNADWVVQLEYSETTAYFSDAIPLVYSGSHTFGINAVDTTLQLKSYKLPNGYDGVMKTATYGVYSDKQLTQQATLEDAFMFTFDQGDAGVLEVWLTILEWTFPFPNAGTYNYYVKAVDSINVNAFPCTQYFTLIISISVNCEVTPTTNPITIQYYGTPKTEVVSFTANPTGCIDLTQRSDTIVRTDTDTTMPQFISYTSPTISLSTIAGRNWGVYNFKVTATFGSVSKDVNIQIEMNCVLSSLTLVSTNLSQTVNRDVSALQADVYNVPYYSSNCGDIYPDALYEWTTGTDQVTNKGVAFSDSTCTTLIISENTPAYFGQTFKFRLFLVVSFYPYLMWGVSHPSSFTFDLNMVKGVTSISITGSIQNQTYDISSGTLILISLPAYTVMPSDCQAYATVTWTLDASNISSLDSVTSSQLQIYIQNTAQAGLHLLTVTATVNASTYISVTNPSPSATTSFSVDIYCGITTISEISFISNINYVIGTNAITQPNPTFNVEPVLCAQAYTLTLAGTRPAALVQYDNAVMTISSSDSTLIGQYSLSWDVAYRKGTGTQGTYSIPFLLDANNGNVVVCSTTSLTASPALSLQTYEIGTTKSITATTFQTNCGVTVLASFVYELVQGQPPQIAQGVTLNADGTIDFTISDPQLVGQHQFQLNASSGGINASSTFLVDYHHTLPTSTLVKIDSQPSILTPITVVVGAPPTTIQLALSLDPPTFTTTYISTLFPTTQVSQTVSYSLDPVNTVMRFSASSPSDQGTYSFVFTTLANSSTYINASSVSPGVMQFSVKVVASCQTLTLASTAQSQVNYTIGTDPIQQPFPSYTGLPQGCILDLKYEVVLISKTTDARFAKDTNFNQPSTALPTLLKWDASAGFTIQGSDYHEGWNTYVVRVTARDSSQTNLAESSYRLEVTTVVNCAANNLILSGSPSTDLSYKIGSMAQTTFFPYALDSMSISAGIPQICGPVTCVVSETDSSGSIQSQLPSFAKFNPMTLTIETSDTSKGGFYYLQFDYFLSYFKTDPAIKHAKQLVKLTLTSEANSMATSSTNQTMTNSTISLDPTSPGGLNATGVGNKTTNSNMTAISNSTAVIHDLVKGDAQANQTEALVQQVAQFMMEVQGTSASINMLKFLPAINPPSKGMKASLRYADVRIKEVQRNSLVILQINEPVHLVNEGAWIDPGLLSVDFLKNSEEDVHLANWELKGYSETQIQLQLTFSEPLLVSAGVQRDVVQISLSRALLLPVNNPIFYEPLRRDLLQSQNRVILTEDLPVMVKSESDFVKLDSAKKTLQKSTTATVVVPMIAQVALKGAMKKLWFYFNTMQLADTFTEFNNVKAPANVEMISTAYKDIIHVQMLPPEVMNQVKAHMGLKSNTTNTTESHRSLLAAPTTKSIFILRVVLGGLGGCLLVGLVVVAICHKRIWYRLSRNMQKQLRAIYHRIFWNMFIRILLEIFYPMMLLSLKALSVSEKPQREWMDMAKVAVFAVFMLFTFIFLIEKREEVDVEAFKERYGAYLTNVETYLKPAAVHYPTVFMLRRLFMAVTIAYLKFNLVTQVLCAVHSSLLMLSWLVLIKPFDSKFKNYLECTNEAIVLVLAYFGFLFSDYVESPVMRYQFGFFYIGLIALGLSINVLALLWQTSADLLKVYRRWRHKKSVQTQQAVTQALEQQKLASKQEQQKFMRSFEHSLNESESEPSAISISINESEVVMSSQNELLRVTQTGTNQEVPHLIDRKRVDQLERIAQKFVRDNNQFLPGFCLGDTTAVKILDGVTMEDQVPIQSLKRPPQLKPVIDDLEGLPQVDDFFEENQRNQQIESESQGSPTSDSEQPKVTDLKPYRPKTKHQASKSIATDPKRFKSPAAQRPDQFGEADRILAQLEEEIKRTDEEILKIITQADPLAVAKLHDEKQLSRVRVKLRQGPSATISELLSQIREIQEQKQKHEDLEDDETPGHNYGYSNPTKFR